MHKGYHRKTDGKHDVGADLRGHDAEPIQKRPEQDGEKRFGEPAQAEAGHGDAKLGGAEIGGEILQDVPGQTGAAVAFHDEDIQLGVAQFDEGKFGRDEKAVDEHQHPDAHDPKALR